MKNFKTFLNEGAMTNAVKTLNVTKFTIADLQIASEHAGYTDEFEGYTQLVYGSYSEKSGHKFYMLWENVDADDEDKPFAINEMYVALGKSGFIECEPGSMPQHDGMTKDEGVKKLASLKGK